ncbi:MAG: FixH family protein [Polymorphobacter sp.]|uniref:FixH family protein n=1 Tax=Polymorphobacter sp. TaxID=1909290 RepID=UPI003A8B7BD5
MRTPFTGRHMWALMLGFFGITIAVNFGMAWVASSTFGGTVVDNSYVAGQKYNGWLAESRAQATLGWNVEVSLDPARHVEVRTRMAGAEVSGVAVHPLGRAPEQTLVFRPMAGGYVSQAPLPPGRYRVRVEIMSAGRTADFLAEVSGG